MAQTKIRLSPWTMLTGEYEEHCAVRIVEGGDVNSVADRMALIEKSPRVRLYPFSEEKDFENWHYGRKGNDEYGKNKESRQWCDEQLIDLGYELTN